MLLSETLGIETRWGIKNYFLLGQKTLRLPQFHGPTLLIRIFQFHSLGSFFYYYFTYGRFKKTLPAGGSRDFYHYFWPPLPWWFDAIPNSDPYFNTGVCLYVHVYVQRSKATYTPLLTSAFNHELYALTHLRSFQEMFSYF